MKNQITILLIILASLVGCRTIKDRSSAANKLQQYNTETTTLEWSFTDSAGRYWHYRTDSLLFYHPDVGLYGHGGWLSVSESQVEQGELRFLQDSSAYQNSESRAERTVSTSRRMPWWGWGVVGVGLCLIFGIGLARRLGR